MDTIVCLRCGTENPDDVVNCKECRINLKWASENLEVDDLVKQSQEVLTGAQLERSSLDWGDKISIGCSSLLGLILFVLLVILSPLRNTAGIFLPFLSSFGFLLGWGIAYFIVKQEKAYYKANCHRICDRDITSYCLSWVTISFSSSLCWWYGTLNRRKSVI